MAARVDKIIAEYDLKLQEFNKDINKVKKGLKSTEKQGKKSAAGVSKSFNGLKSTFVSLGLAMSAAFVLKKTIKDIADFETAIANLSAITGAAGEELDFYKKKAVEMSNASTLAAKDVVLAFKLVGSAVPELLKSKEALAEVTENAIILSEAANLDLGLAAKALGETLNQFSLDASESARVINELAAASQLGAKEIPFINEALSKFGGIAEKAGEGTNIAISAIEILGKVIPEASIAGNAMKGILINMQIEAAKAGREFMGLEAELEFYAKDINNVGKLTRIFRQENLLSIQTLIQNREELTLLSKSITGTNTALEQAAINTDTLATAWVKLGNAWTNATLSGSGVAGVLKDIINTLSDGLKLLTSTDEMEFNKSIDAMLIKSADIKGQLEMIVTNRENDIKREQSEIDKLTELRKAGISNRKSALLAEEIREWEAAKAHNIGLVKIAKERLEAIAKLEVSDKVGPAATSAKVVEETDKEKKAREKARLAREKEVKEGGDIFASEADLALVRLETHTKAVEDAAKEELEIKAKLAADLDELGQLSFETERQRLDRLTEINERRYKEDGLSFKLYTEYKAELSNQYAQLEVDNSRLILSASHEIVSGLAGLAEDGSKFQKALVIADIVVQEAMALAQAIPVGLKQAKDYKEAIKNTAILQGAIQATFRVIEQLAKSRETSTAPSFEVGGYTGEGNKKDIAGAVHKKEYVQPAGPTKKYRTELDAMRSGNFDSLIFTKYIKPERDYARSVLQNLNLQAELNDTRINKNLKTGNRLSMINTDRLVEVMKPRKRR